MDTLSTEICQGCEGSWGLNWEIWVTPRMILSLARGFPLLGFQRQLGSKALLHQDVTHLLFWMQPCLLQPVKSSAQPLDSELVWRGQGLHSGCGVNTLFASQGRAALALAQIVSVPGGFPATCRGLPDGCCCPWLALVGWVLEWGQEGLVKGAGGSSPGRGWLHSGHTGGAIAQPRIKCESPRCRHLTVEPLSSPQGAPFSFLFASCPYEQA